MPQAGADPEAIPRWVKEGRRRAESARKTPHSGYCQPGRLRRRSPERATLFGAVVFYTTPVVQSGGFRPPRRIGGRRGLPALLSSGPE